MYIGFTGHRNKKLNNAQLKSIAELYKNDIWVHGGAVGFDSQIEELAYINNIKTMVIKPDYNKYKMKAPIIRNMVIVNNTRLLIACYDGRKSGGTYFTIKYAKKLAKDITIFNPDTNVIETIKFDRRYWICDSIWANGLLITYNDNIVGGAPIFKKLFGKDINAIKQIYKITELEGDYL